MDTQTNQQIVRRRQGPRMINGLRHDTLCGPVRPNPHRPPVWDDHNTNMWGSPAVPEAAGRHLHKAAPVLAWLTLTWRRMWEGRSILLLPLLLFPPLCLSRYLDGTVRLQQRRPDRHQAFIILLWLLSDQSVCRGETFADLATLPPQNLSSYPPVAFVPVSPDLCAGLPVEPPHPGPHGGWPEVSVWCAAVGQRRSGGGGVKSADYIGTATHMTSRSQFHSIVSVPDSHAAPWCKQHSLR